MKFIDDRNKKLNWYNQNYFFLGTVVIISLNILLFAVLGNDFTNGIGGNHVWYDTLNFSNLVRGFLNSLEHADWEHVLLNMLCFAGCGLYMERKTGTINFILLVLGFSVIDGAFGIAASMDVNSHGASGVVYMCYAYIIIDYIFSFHKRKRNRTNTILGAVILCLMYFAMCFNTGSGAPFLWYPCDLITNAGHYYSIIAGFIISLIIQVSQLMIIIQTTPSAVKKNPPSRKFYILPAIFLTLLTIITPTLAIIANNRTNAPFTINIDCNYDQFDTTLNYNVGDRAYGFYYNFLPDFRERYTIQERRGYYFEVFDDKEYKKETNVKTFPYGYGIDFIPLAKPTTKTYYIKMFEGNEVHLHLEEIDKYFQTDDIISENHKDNLFSFCQSTGYATLIVENNKDCLFKLPYPRYSDLVLEANGQELTKDENGFYLIKNVDRYTWIKIYRRSEM